MKRILITGGNGLMGSAFRKLLGDIPNVTLVGRDDYDLTRESEVVQMYGDTRPQYVIHAAARVGGIGRNLDDPVEQFYDNIMMNTLVLHQAFLHDVEKLIAFSSSCAFPAEAAVLEEGILHDGLPFAAHGSYAHAKRMVEVQASTLRERSGRSYCTIIPGNIYGEEDNFDLEHGHVVPALIHRCYLARSAGKDFEVWGDGSASREFLYAEDVARICLELMQFDILPGRLIVAAEKSYKIREIVDIICEKMQYQNIRWLTHKPNGQSFRKSSLKLFREYFPEFTFTDIEDGLERTISWFDAHYPRIRMCL